MFHEVNPSGGAEGEGSAKVITYKEDDLSPEWRTVEKHFLPALQPYGAEPNSDPNAEKLIADFPPPPKESEGW